MTKLSKSERTQITHAIEDTLENYCRADCPYFGLNTPSEVCQTCPVSLSLLEIGSKLWSKDELKPIVKSPWTTEEDDFLISSRGKMKLVDIAKALGKSLSLVDKRVRHLKNERLI